MTGSSLGHNARAHRFDVFISYRRKGGDKYARLFQEALSARGLRCCLDVSQREPGPFPDRLLRYLDSADNVLVVLSPNALDRRGGETWFHKELAYALRQNINVVPVLVDDFEFERPSATEADERLARLDAVHYSHHFFDRTLEQAIGYLRLSRGRRLQLAFRRYRPIALAFLLLLVFGGALIVGRPVGYAPSTPGTSQHQAQGRPVVPNVTEGQEQSTPPAAPPKKQTGSSSTPIAGGLPNGTKVSRPVYAEAKGVESPTSSQTSNTGRAGKSNGVVPSQDAAGLTTGESAPSPTPTPQDAVGLVTENVASQDVRPVAFAPPASTPAVPEPARDSQAADRTQIGEALNRYVQAYEQQNANALRAVWPTVPRLVTDNLSLQRSYRLVLANVVIQFASETASVRCTRKITAQPRVGKERSADSPTIIWLRKTDAGWLITNVE